MEIFVQNLPTGQRKRSVKRAIANAIRATFREKVEFDWQFTRRRDSARLTLPTIEMAEEFLVRYSSSGLAIRGRHGTYQTIRFNESRYRPDARLIEGLQQAMEERRAASQSDSEHEDSDSVDDDQLSPRQDAHYMKYFMRFQAIHWGVWIADGSFGRCGMFKSPGRVAYNSETGQLELIAMKPEAPNPFGATIENITIEELLVDRSHTPSRLYFTVNRIPQFWSEDRRAHLQPYTELYQMSKSDLDDRELRRMLRAVFGSFEPENYRVPALSSEHAVHAPYCTVYAIDVGVYHLENSVRALLKAMNRRSLEDYPQIETLSEFEFSASHQRLRQLYAYQDYRISFQMESWIRNCLLLPSEVLELNAPIQSLIRETGVEATGRVLQNLVSFLPLRTYEELSQGRNNLELFENSKKYQNWVPRSSDDAVIHRLDVTPAAYNMEGPEWMGSNRVLRMFPDHHDHFLKVSFVEENLTKIQQGRDFKLDAILSDRWELILNGGLQLCGRTFQFLGFSSSSLKEHSVWFLSPFELDGRLVTADSVRDQLGDFSHIRCPPRLAARIGQTFTTTTHSFDLAPGEVKKIEDITRGGYIFSDGVGTISQELLECIWKRTITDKSATKPVVYQIRLGGSKGVLSLDKTLKDRQVCLRPAMTKFEAANTHLELANKGHIIQFFLNRQFIVLLESLGLPRGNLITLQDREVNSLALASRSVEDAKRLYRRYSLGVASDLSGILDTLRKEEVDEIFAIPFFRRLNNMALAHALKQIKFKTRVAVEDSWVLIGVMDEFGFLEADEIYVCLRDDRNGDIRYLEGDTLVTRSPALHCGDIQKAYAIGSVDETHPLSALYNCIVFSSRGSRPLPNMLGGGDLDGDIYSVSQHPLLIPPRWERPLEYEYVPPKDLGGACEMSDITKFFVDFIINDNLGQICNRHLILADEMEQGAMHPDCVRLSRLASTAVDFPKTGVPVNLQDSPKVKTYRKPDFMAYRPISLADLIELDSTDPQDPNLSGTRPDRVKYYRSRKVLGQMYRRVDIESLLTQWNSNSDLIQEIPQRMWLKFEARLQQIVPCYKERWTEFLREAQEVFDEYMNELQMIQRYYHPTPWRKRLSEAEVFLQCINNVAPSIRSVRGRGTNEYTQGLRQAYEGLVGWVRSGIGTDSDCKFQRLAAYFYVGIQSDKWPGKRREGESFAWIVFKDLHDAWQRVKDNGFVDDDTGEESLGHN